MNKNVGLHNALTSKEWRRSEVTPQPNVTLLLDNYRHHLK